jgi:hypothetical protein
MRTLAILLVLSVFVLGAFALARADERPFDPQALQSRIEGLELQVKYLREREKALTRYVLLNQARADGLDDIARRARVAGFEARQIPVDSRKILLAGLEALARSLRKDVPLLTREQRVLLKKIEAQR